MFHRKRYELRPYLKPKSELSLPILGNTEAAILGNNEILIPIIFTGLWENFKRRRSSEYKESLDRHPYLHE